MESKDFKYDVAFSFLQEDEELAVEINELIKGRLETFIYSERQLELAGKDGEIAFSNVFKNEARSVFVLYRKGWGESPWTRIEETAIRGRAYEQGYDFVIFAPLDKPPSPPTWLPKNRIWIGTDRYGVDGAAAVIEARVQELGAQLKEITPAAHAARLSRELEFEKYREAFLQSTEAVDGANEEVRALFEELDFAVGKAAEQTRDIWACNSLDKYVLNVGGFGLLVYWSRPYGNTVYSSVLYISVFDGAVSLDGNYFPREKPTRLEETEYCFDLNRTKVRGWRQRNRQDTFYSTKDLARLCIEKIYARALQSRRRGSY